MRLKDKVAIITGGSRGIGFATADAFLREGAKVAVAASSEKNAEAAVEKLKAIHPDAEVVGISPNLGSFESVKEEFDKVEKQFGRIDILVNNAGVSESTPFTSYTEADFDRVIDLNVKGVFNATRAVVDGMIKNHSGVVLNTSSMVSISGQPSGFAYPASKFAVNGTTISLARELGPKRNPCQCSCSGNYGNRHDESRSEKRDRADDRTDSASQTRTAGRHCKCICISCI